MLNAEFTMCFMDVIKLAPDTLENIQMSTPSRTSALVSMLHATYDNREISAETIPEFKLFIEMKFNQHKAYYEEVLDIYEASINWADGEKVVLNDVTGGSKTVEYTPRAKYTTTDTFVPLESSTNTHYDLPRSDTSENRPSTKDVTERGGSNTNTRVSVGTEGKDTTAEGTTGSLSRTSTRVNAVEQKKKALSLLRNVYLEFAEKFGACFLDIYF